MTSDGINPVEDAAENTPQPRAPLTAESAAEGEGKTSRPPVLLVIGALAVALALFAGVQIIGVLYGMVFPPEPPLPDGAVQIEHEDQAHGVDSWRYRIEQDACQVARHYAEQDDASCNIAPQLCETGTYSPPNTLPQNVAQCRGEIEFSIFIMTWEANISGGYGERGPTQIQLDREVSWFGSD
jgi:hypothetical protein